MPTSNNCESTLQHGPVPTSPKLDPKQTLNDPTPTTPNTPKLDVSLYSMGVPLLTNSPPYDDYSIPFPPPDWMQRGNPTPDQVLFSEAVYCTSVVTMRRADRSDTQNLNLIERYFDLL